MNTFRLGEVDGGRLVLCIDEDSDKIGIDGEAFFNEEGGAAKAVLDVLDFLTRIENNRKLTMDACATLQKHQLIQPWSIRVRIDVVEQQVEGLCCIDEAALNRLSADALIEIRDAGALSLAYCQLLSMQQISVLERMAQAEQQSSCPAKPDFEFLYKDGTINFGNLA